MGAATMQQQASSAASAAVAALQQPCEGSREELASLLGAANYVCITLRCSETTALASGNLLAGGAQPSLQAFPGTWAAVVCRDRTPKLLRHGSHHMPDAQAVAATGCGTLTVCLPLAVNDASAASCSCSCGDATESLCLGALTVGFPTAADFSGEALKGALLLAYSLASEQRVALQELSGLVSSMLLPPPPPPRAPDHGYASDGSDLDFGADWDCATSDDDSGSSCSDSDAAGDGEQRPCCEAPPHSRSLLAYTSPRLERRFARYHAQHMQHVDCWAYALCLVFFLTEAFLPGTPFRLAEKMGWKCLTGMGGILPGLLLLFPRTRPWFAAHRELLLAATWVYITGFMTTICNYLYLVDRDTFRSPLYLQSYGWLSVVGLAFQMRFRWQVLAAAGAYAINTQLLPLICSTHFEELPPARCVALGLLRIFLHGVLLPLACCFVFETHARRLFLRTQRRDAR